MLSMVVLHFGYLLLVPAAFVIARLARQRARVLASVGARDAGLGTSA